MPNPGRGGTREGGELDKKGLRDCPRLLSDHVRHRTAPAARWGVEECQELPGKVNGIFYGAPLPAPVTPS
eukprot:7113669-Pyramimonas_sp.AAC.1